MWEFIQWQRGIILPPQEAIPRLWGTTPPPADGIPRLWGATPSPAETTPSLWGCQPPPTDGIPQLWGREATPEESCPQLWDITPLPSPMHHWLSENTITTQALITIAVGFPLTLLLSSATEQIILRDPMRLLSIKTALFKLPEAHRAQAKC